MSQALLGNTLDIHGGGLDLQFPHHENELAQSESDTNEPFARIWMHNGLLRMRSADGTVSKMGRSIGNVVNIADLLARHSPETVRLLLLSTHYRSPIEYSEARLDEVARSLNGFYRFFERYERITGSNFYDLPRNVPTVTVIGELAGEIAELQLRYFSNLDDDFNTGGAVGILFELLALLNRFADERKLDAANAPQPLLDTLHSGTRVLRTFSDLLGLFWEAPVRHSLGEGGELVAGLMQLILDVRANLRDQAKGATKDNPLKKPLFAQTDLIRTRLGELKVTLEDRTEGTTWRVG